MYIRGLIPRNFAELAEAVLIALDRKESLEEFYSYLCTRYIGGN